MPNIMLNPQDRLHKAGFIQAYPKLLSLLNSITIEYNHTQIILFWCVSIPAHINGRPFDNWGRDGNVD